MRAELSMHHVMLNATKASLLSSRSLHHDVLDKIPRKRHKSLQWMLRLRDRYRTRSKVTLAHVSRVKMAEDLESQKKNLSVNQEHH